MNKGKILVFEPDNKYAQIFFIYFPVFGCTVFITTTIEECLNTLKNEMPDIVFFATATNHLTRENEFQIAAQCDLLNVKIIFLVERGLSSQNSGLFGLCERYSCIDKPFDLNDIHEQAAKKIQGLNSD